MSGGYLAQVRFAFGVALFFVLEVLKCGRVCEHEVDVEAVEARDDVHEAAGEHEAEEEEALPDQVEVRVHRFQLPERESTVSSVRRRTLRNATKWGTEPTMKPSTSSHEYMSSIMKYFLF